MGEPTAAHARELGDYIALVRRRWRWVVGMALLGLALGFAYLNVAQVQYTATAKVLVKPTLDESTTQTVGGRTNDVINLDTEAQLVRSQPVAQRAADLLGTSLSPVALVNRVSVTVPPNTTVLAISFAANTAAGAQTGAETFANAYLENRQEAAQAAIDADVRRLRDRAALITQHIQDTNVALARLTGSAERDDRAFLLARRSALSNELESYDAQLAPLVGERAVAGEIIVDAPLPKRPANPDPMLILPAGLMVGLVMGLAAAAWRERSDPRIHSSADVERVFGVTPLLSMPPEAGLPGTPGGHDVVALYHHLRAGPADQGQVVLLVGPDAPAVAEQLAYSLAVVAARSGSPTTYVTRTESPVLLERHRTRVENSGTLQLPSYEDLGIVVDGDFQSSRLRDELDDLTERREVVILGLPNDEPFLDIPVLARHVDVAVVVVALSTSRRRTTGAVLADLSSYGVGRVVSVTVARSTRRTRRRNARSLAAAHEVRSDENKEGEEAAASRTDRARQGKGGTAFGRDARRSEPVPARTKR